MGYRYVHTDKPLQDLRGSGDSRQENSADKIGDGFIVHTRTVHDTIELPTREEAEYKRLEDMVREVNDTQVDAEERLSYHVYVYSRDEEVLKIVA